MFHFRTFFHSPAHMWMPSTSVRRNTTDGCVCTRVEERPNKQTFCGARLVSERPNAPLIPSLLFHQATHDHKRQFSSPAILHVASSYFFTLLTFHCNRHKQTASPPPHLLPTHLVPHPSSTHGLLPLIREQIIETYFSCMRIC